MADRSGVMLAGVMGRYFLRRNSELGEYDVISSLPGAGYREVHLFMLAEVTTPGTSAFSGIRRAGPSVPD